MIKIKFREFLSEYRGNIPQGQIYTKLDLRQFIENEDDVMLLRCHISVDQKDYVIFQKTFDAKNIFLILANRVDYTEIAGYMVLQQVDASKHSLFQVLDVAIYPEFRNRGLGSELYMKAVTVGMFSLINGFSVSTEAERIWEKLKAKKLVSIWDKSNDSFHEISSDIQKPENDQTTNNQQTKFYCASAKIIELENWLSETIAFGEAYEIWLRGIQPYGYGMFRFYKDFYDGF